MPPPPAALLDRLEIARGDVLFVKASMNRLGYGGAETVALLDALLDRLGPEGTVVMPSFPYANEVGRPSPGAVFDVRRTASQMGLLSEVLRRHAGTERSAQYWVPACAWGARARALTQGQLHVVNPFAAASTYARLPDAGCRMVGLGVSLNYNILAHVADAVLEPRYPFRVFDTELLRGTVVTEDGLRHETYTATVSQARRRLMRPARLVDASAPLTAALRLFDLDGAFVWALPGPLYLEEALGIGAEALDRGGVPPWLAAMP
jgi:aminoglycoside N3'-acetyltransferase